MCLIFQVPFSFLTLFTHPKSFLFLQPDLLKQLFNSANQNRYGNEVKAGNVNAIKAEDIEKGIPSEQSNMKGIIPQFSRSLFYSLHFLCVL